MSTIYHILDKIPGMHADEMQVEYEQLANALVKSGKLRVDTDLNRNFILYSDTKHDINLTVTKEELTKKELIPITKSRFEELYKKYYKEQNLEKKLTSIFQKLNVEANKLVCPPHNNILKLARIFVQSAHSIVIRWLFIDKVEVFLTYSHSIGDVMDVISWKQSGQNSGMQSTDGKNVAIFVSCGGDPFIEDYPPRALSADGWCAIARMQIIAAQELGHFADIKRDETGRQISRHSANFSGTKATEHTIKARKNDINRCNYILKKFYDNGLKLLTTTEKKLKFYKTNKVSNLASLKLKFILYFQRKKFIRLAQKNQFLFIRKFIQDEYMGLMIIRMVEDMISNLTPLADVYKRDNKDAEEAISCIEALARVPQQSVKWGHITAAFFMHDLYKIYYKEVIPSLIHNYQALTKSQFKPNLKIPSKKIVSFLKKINIFAKSKFVLTPVREVYNESEKFK